MSRRPDLGKGTVIRTVAVREDQDLFLRQIPNVSAYIRGLIDRDPAFRRKTDSKKGDR